jgi:hypothetical protein
MKKPFKTHNDELISLIDGTSAVGTIRASYADLVATFGKPMRDDIERKTDAEWQIKFDDGTRATIYNWKNGPNWWGDDGTPVEQITRWNIGGFGGSACNQVLATLNRRGRASGDRIAIYRECPFSDGDFELVKSFPAWDEANARKLWHSVRAQNDSAIVKRLPVGEPVAEIINAPWTIES